MQSKNTTVKACIIAAGVCATITLSAFLPPEAAASQSSQIKALQNTIQEAEEEQPATSVAAEVEPAGCYETNESIALTGPDREGFDQLCRLLNSYLMPVPPPTAETIQRQLTENYRKRIGDANSYFPGFLKPAAYYVEFTNFGKKGSGELRLQADSGEKLLCLLKKEAGHVKIDSISFI